MLCNKNQSRNHGISREILSRTFTAVSWPVLLSAAVLAITTCFVCLQWLQLDIQLVSYIVMVEVLPFFGAGLYPAITGIRLKSL